MRKSNKIRIPLLSSAVVMVLAPSLVSAAGIALIEGSARGQGNSYAGASAHLPDASTIFFNPAGMTDLDGDHISLAAHYILTDAKFNNDGSTSASALASTPFASLSGDDAIGDTDSLVGNLYWVKSLEEGRKFGLGVYAPFGSSTEYNDTWVGRYHATKSKLKIININPSYAAKASEDFSWGVGLDVMIGSVSMSQQLDLGAACFGALGPTTCQSLGALPQQADGSVKLEGDNHDDISVGFNLGLRYKVSPNGILGISYRSEVDMEMEGTADYTLPASLATSPLAASPTLTDKAIQAELNLPASLAISYAHQSGDLTYLFDVTWTDWSVFEEILVEDENGQAVTLLTQEWDDSLRYAFGVDYQYSEDTVYRFGVAFDEAPVPNAERHTPRIPGGDRIWVSLGVSKQVDESLSIDLGYTYIKSEDADINNTIEPPNPYDATLSGEFTDTGASIFSAQVNWRY